MFFIFPKNIKYLEKVAAKDINFGSVLWNQVKYHRLKSFFPLPTEFSFFILAIFPIFIYFIYKKKVKYIISVPLTIIILLALIFSKSFGILVGFTAIFIALFLYLPMDRKIREIISVSLFFIVLSIGSLISFFRGQDLLSLTPLRLRSFHWIVAIKEFLSSPFYGIGLGNFGPYSNFFSLSSEPHSKYAHNFVLQIIAELGFIGILFLIISTIFLFKFLKGIEKTPINIALISSLFVLISYNFIDIGVYFPSIGILFSFIMGFLIKKSKIRKKELDIKGKLIIVIILLFTIPIFYSEYKAQNAKLFWNFDKEKSFNYALKASKIISFNPTAQTVIISYYLSKGEIKKAETAFKKLERIDPVSLTTYKLKLAIAEQKGDIYEILSTINYVKSMYKNDHYFVKYKEKIEKR